MVSMSEKARLIVPLMLLFLVAVTSVAGFNNYISVANQGRISYANVSSTCQSELRGVLIKHLGDYPHNETLIAQTLAQYGFNAVYLEMSPFAWTGYSMSLFQDMINACRQYNLTFHVLVLLNSGTGPTYTNAGETSYPYGFSGYDPTWVTNLDNGSAVNYISFSSTSARNRVKQVIQTMLTYFPDIADINLDYVRYPTSDLSSIPNINMRVPYDNASKTAFLAWLTSNGKTFSGNWSDYYYGGSLWTDFATWRAVPINNIVRDIRVWALASKPTVKISADVWTPWNVQGWTPDLLKNLIGQDTPYWISQGYLDYVNPMNYVPDLASLKYRMSNETTYWLGGTSKGPILMVPFITQGGPGGDVTTPIAINTWLQQIDFLRSSGCNGFIIWRYNGPGLSESPPYTDIRPYLAAIQNSSSKGAFPAFKQTSPAITGSTITWSTSLPTTGRVEYSLTPMFTAISQNGTLLEYTIVNYTTGTILFEATPTLTHSITVPLSPPFYYRIASNDSNVELYSPMYQVT